MHFAMSSLGFVLIFLVLGQTLATKIEGEFEEVTVVCLERNDITEEEFKALAVNAKDIDRKFKCFAYCLAEELGYLDEAGKINLENIEKDEGIGDAEMTKFIACKAKHDMEDDNCEYAYKMMVCTM